MKKKIVKRIWIGFPVGIAMGYIITLVISACIGDGTLYSATPEFVQRMGTELSAVILQTALCGILGSGFAAASVIWEIFVEPCQAKRRVLYRYRGHPASHRLCDKLDAAFYSGAPVLCRNFYRYLHGRLAFSVFMLEGENQKNELLHPSREKIARAKILAPESKAAARCFTLWD